MRIRRLAGVVAAAALLLGSMGVAAVAAPPPNDDVATPTPVTALPFSIAQDTSEATTAATDPVPWCAGPVGATVWFSYTAMDDGYLEVNTFGSDYDTVLAVYAGEPIDENEVACNDDYMDLTSSVRFPAVSGETYLVMVGSFGSGPGGSLMFQADVGAPPVQITVTIDPRGSVVPKTGEATIYGTVTCSEPTMLGIDSWLRQRSGRLYIDGWGFTEVQCDGTATWEITIADANGLFTGGKADAQVNAFSFDQPDAYAFAEQTVQLTGAKAAKAK